MTGIETIFITFIAIVGIAFVLCIIFLDWVPGHGLYCQTHFKHIDLEPDSIFTTEEISRVHATVRVLFSPVSRYFRRKQREVRLYKFWDGEQDVTKRVGVLLGRQLNEDGEIIHDIFREWTFSSPEMELLDWVSVFRVSDIIKNRLR